MEGKSIYIVMKEDLIYYPPILSLIDILLNKSYNVYCLAIYTDIEEREKLIKRGAVFEDVGNYNVHGNSFIKLFQLLKYKRKVIRYFQGRVFNSKDYIWIAQNENIRIFHYLIERYPTIIHQLEFTTSKISWKYWMVSPFVNLSKVYRSAAKVVCCEYNRAHITKGMYNLTSLPEILPNKTEQHNLCKDNVPSYLINQIKKIELFSSNKKVIVYQGVFSSKERKLEEFCQAINMLSDDYVMIVMGRGSEYYDSLKEKYNGNRIMFVPFIAPPHYLHITKLAYIGVLSYYPSPKNIGSVINPIYCAPNKIYEYARFGIPMISNDIPGLHYIFKEFNCGLTVNYPVTPNKIAEKILQINGDYETFSSGAKNFNDHTCIDTLIDSILL